jgi:hypothetical protein
VALPFTIKGILRQNKNYETQIFTLAKIKCLKNPLKETKKIIQDIITL